MNKLYCSTGAFTGRVNGRNHRFVIEYGGGLDCDGFEVMLMSDWMDELDSIAAEYKKSRLACPVIHAEKRIGNWVSDCSGSKDKLLKQIWTADCRFGKMVGAEKIVCHIWGIPDSDAHMDRISDCCGNLMKIAENYELDMVSENCFCINGSPLQHFIELTKRYPAMGITLDTRPAQFHNELSAFMDSDLFENENIRHIHINDYAGGYKDWNAMYPIPQPGKGNIDFKDFFKKLKRNSYKDSITLEAPSMLPDKIDTDTLNRSLNWIRDQMK